MAIAEEYLKEHYAAARHQQTMRFQALTILGAASAVLLTQGVSSSTPGVVFTSGGALIILAIIAFVMNEHFQFANRYHVEVAKQTRERLSDKEAGTDQPPLLRSEVQNPNLIGEAVRLTIERKIKYDKALEQVRAQEKAQLRIGKRLDLVLLIIPALMSIGGVFLIFRGINLVSC